MALNALELINERRVRVQPRRTDLEIYGAILYALSAGGKEMLPTRLMYSTNLSWSKLRKSLQKLTSLDLVSEREAKAIVPEYWGRMEVIDESEIGRSPRNSGRAGKIRRARVHRAYSLTEEGRRMLESYDRLARGFQILWHKD